MFGRIFKSLLARQVAQHGSVAAVALGLFCNLLGIPLAGEQISLLITAGSVVLYLVSQVRALWHPPAASPPVLRPPPSMMARLTPLVFFIAFAHPLPAHADTGLVQICTNPAMAGHVAQDCILTLKWDAPVPTDLVLTRPLGSSGDWDNTTIWRSWSTLTTQQQYRTCPMDLPKPSVHGGNPYVPDPCRSPPPLWVTVAATATESHLITIVPATQKEDGTALLPAEIRSHRLQCGVGSNTGPWLVDDELAMPVTSRTYDFPAGSWNCHAWTVANYQCSAQSSPNCESAHTPDLLFSIPMAIHLTSPNSPTLTIK